MSGGFLGESECACARHRSGECKGPAARRGAASLGERCAGAGVGGRGHRPAGPPQEVAGKTQAAPSTAGRSDSTDRKKFKKLGRKLTPEAVDSIRALKT